MTFETEKSATAAFANLVNRADEEVPLAQAALAIAAIEYPDIDVSRCLAQLDAIADGFAPIAALEDSREAQILALSRHLFEVEGFTGNATDYYDPANSCINEVLDTRLGIPITLAVIYLDVAWRFGYPTAGVGFPGHFLVKWEIEEGSVVIDPFRQGKTLTLNELNIQARLAGVDVDAASLLGSCSRRDILIRMLRNLWIIYAHRKTQDRQLTALNMLLAISPDEIQELTARAELLESIDCFAAAVDDLSQLRMLGVEQMGSGESVADEIRRLGANSHTVH